ncbi:hypothetical protein Tel_05140 [Candidatus Tenderia electrophaga]|jgi:hypothetical protein|uniref:ABC-type transport auxiliary lipoprotein component domain-containing protein n=1 Tax=Candidatus Tenderia electrophaga TaxID=1748243 RepID=A0A0S2TBV3_9GAMM|nr:hypothetical protein Tel_05140 [Candidatus Tenderia electrophaga]
MRTARITLLLTLLGALAACGTTPSSNYYLLSSSAAPSSSIQTPNRLVVGLGPIDFPAYLDRNEIVISSGDNSLQVAEYHRWAEPLQSNFARVLAQALATHIPDAEVYTYPWHSGVQPDVQIRLKVGRFDVNTQNHARLSARWELSEPSRKMRYPPQSREYVIDADSGDYEARVRALSRCVGALSRDLAAALNRAQDGAANH